VKKLILVLLVGVIAAQTTAKEEQPQPYADQDVYAIYSTIIDREWGSIPHEPQQLFISDQTVIIHKVCLRPDSKTQAILEPAIADYLKANQRPRSLGRFFHIDKPYDLVAASSTSVPYWIGFSAVGFNEDRTVALVAVDTVHLPHTSSGSFVVPSKKDGKWLRAEYSGNHCAWFGD